MRKAHVLFPFAATEEPYFIVGLASELGVVGVSAFGTMRGSGARKIGPTGPHFSGPGEHMVQKRRSLMMPNAARLAMMRAGVAPRACAPAVRVAGSLHPGLPGCYLKSNSYINQ